MFVVVTKREELRVCARGGGHVDFLSSGIFFEYGRSLFGSCVMFKMIPLSLDSSTTLRTIPPFRLFRRGVDLSRSPLKWESIPKTTFSSFFSFL